MSNWALANGVMRPENTISVQASSTAHTKGTPVEVVSAAPYGVQGIWFTRRGPSLPSGNLLYDVMIGAVSSEIAVFPNLTLPVSDGARDVAHLFVPLSIPYGERVSVAVQCSGASSAAHQIRVAFACGTGLMPVGGSLIIAHGVDTSTTSGTAVTAGGSNSYGTSVQFTSSLTRAARAFAIGTAGGTASALRQATARLVHGAAVAQIGAPYHFPFTGTEVNCGGAPLNWQPCSIPAGADLRIQVANNDGNTGTRNYILYTLH